ncbi:hypothetical protein [Streptodolium elevatio]|uniref:Uncharacterized protein n=1 Tax=Streptodolium elevatio TaxID=3157996 RepID=A0ABV3DHM8_9ACTN
MTNSPAATDLPLDQLTAALRAGAAGHLPGEAAVALLVEHDVWPRRADFRAYIDYTDDADVTDTPLAKVRWSDAVDARLPGASGETLMLRIAASLAVGTPVALAEVSALGWHSTGLVLRALAHTSGHQADIAVTAPKTFDPDAPGGWTTETLHSF